MRRPLGPPVNSPGARSRQNDVAGLETYAETVDLAGQPGDRGDRVAEYRVAASLGHDLTVAGQHRVNALDIDVLGRDPLLAEHETGRRGVVGDRVAQRDLPVLDPGVDQFDRRGEGCSGGQHVVLGAARAGKVVGEDEADLDLDPRVREQTAGTGLSW